MSVLCCVDGCSNEARTSGFCQMHYARVRRHGNTGPSESFVINIRENYLREYYSYNSMMIRCYYEKHAQYKDYGGRGIKVCERWLERPGGIKNFIHDMGKRPDGYSLDRIDVNGDYCPENCRWVSKKEQANNRRNSCKITYAGEERTISEWAEKKCLSASVLYNRIMKSKWKIDKALNTPVRRKRKHREI